MNGVPDHEGPHIVSRRTDIPGGSTTLSRNAQLFTIEEHASWLAEVKPAYFRTAPSILAGILDVYESGAVEPPRIEQIMTIAETVTPELRQRARSVLGASIRDRYGSEEAGVMAFQCPHSDEHYHVASTNAFVEVLDDSGRACLPGMVGRVIVTALHNYANPVIRYELNDLAALQQGCACGHAGPVLTNLLGRKRFLVRLPSGERKAVPINARRWLAIAPFRDTRLVQVSEGVLHAELVLDRPLTEQEREAVLSMFRREISPDLTYEIHQVEAIAWAPTFKRQDVVSLV
jgi:phenylacetate-CoA ligase